MKQPLTKIALFSSGALLAFIGGSLMFTPKSFLEDSGIVLQPEPSLMSELTAPSAVLIVTALLMIFAAFRARYSSLALLAGAAVYGSYGLGRVISMLIHGIPSQSLLIALCLELGIAVVLLALRPKLLFNDYQLEG
ncbi:DUF4345 domain-containing protein [Congregibacter sp.]|uniref:DUF4345 domain-containing protein n=1 Tax=Congregibacter sp. TaxID=2744308 RepID=UPI003859BE02